LAKIVVLGSINVDFTTKVKSFPKVGETIKGNQFKISAGGKGANQAVASAKLGGEVMMVGKVGKDEYGKYLVEELQKNGVDTTYVLKEGISGRTFINVDDNGDNTITYIAGANNHFTKEEVNAVDFIFDKADYLVLQQEINMDVLKFVLEKAEEKTCKVILNAAPCQELEEEYLELVDTLVVNEVELAFFFDKELIIDKKQMNEMLDTLLEKGVKKIIVTLGSEGSIYKDEKDFFEIPSLKVEAKDTTAAGDTFIGAYVYARSEGKAVHEAIQFATIVSAIVVSNEGAQSSVPTKEFVMGFIEEQRLNFDF